MSAVVDSYVASHVMNTMYITYVGARLKLWHYDAP